MSPLVLSCHFKQWLLILSACIGYLPHSSSKGGCFPVPNSAAAMFRTHFTPDSQSYCVVYYVLQNESNNFNLYLSYCSLCTCIIHTPINFSWHCSYDDSPMPSQRNQSCSCRLLGLILLAHKAFVSV